MSVINSGSFAKALWPGVNSWYGQAYNEYPVEWDKLFEKHTSNRAFEEDVGTSMFGLAQMKAEGSGIQYDSAKQGFVSRYQPTVYALGFIITREMMDDDLYDVIGKKRAQALAFSMRQTKEIVGANVYNRAFNSSYVGGDGVSLISSAHPNIAGGTWSNQIGTAADLSEAALEQACIDIAGFTNDRGLLIGVRPESLVIPRGLIFEAKRILNTEGRVGTDNNDLNALKNMGMIPKTVVNHFLTDTDAWFIRTNVKDGMKYFERRADSFDMDNDWDTENAKFKATARYVFGWTDPRALYASAGA
jgi:hypothetical protein